MLFIVNKKGKCPHIKFSIAEFLEFCYWYSNWGILLEPSLQQHWNTFTQFFISTQDITLLIVQYLLKRDTVLK